MIKPDTANNAIQGQKYLRYLKKKEIGFMGDVTRKVFDDLEQFGYRVLMLL